MLNFFKSQIYFNMFPYASYLMPLIPLTLGDYNESSQLTQYSPTYSTLPFPSLLCSCL